jgi:hypothetical protein
MPRREGQFLVEDYFTNNGGLNTADSPFVVDASQCTGGKNFDNRKRGGIQKRFGHAKLNAAADTQLKTLGFGLWDKPSSARQALRGAGTKLQNFDVSAHTFANLSEDTTTATTTFLSTTQPVVSSMFNNANAGILWSAGGGMNAIYGMYSATKVTKNGVTPPSGSISVSTGGADGVFASTGFYRYAVALRKTSTQAISNAALFKEVNVTATTQHVTVDLSSITGIDTAKHDKIYIYRSSVSTGAQGNVAFTAGDLVAQVNSNVTSYSDTGTYVSTSEAVPQAGNLALDNSELPTATYTTLALFKQRLVTASGNTVYITDTNKSESWPTVHRITLPAGGDITALGVVSLTSPLSTDIDEALCVFQQRKLWVITGSGAIDTTTQIPDWSLKFVNTSGAPGQAVVVQAEGQIAWVNQRGFYIWNGAGKPKYISRSIEDKFQLSGEVDKSKLNIAWGMYVESRGEIQWCLTSKTYGENQYLLKFDLRSASTSNENTQLGDAELAGIFTPDVLTFPSYAGIAFIAATTSAEETVYYGDAAGFVYSGYTSSLDGAGFVDLEYQTPYLFFGTPGQAKRASKVVVWVLDKGDYTLELTYWSDFRSSSADASTRKVSISPGSTGTGFQWGQAKWGVGTKWGHTNSRPRPITFNLADNNSEGDCIRLQLAQRNSSRQCLLYGFSVYYTELGTRK